MEKNNRGLENWKKLAAPELDGESTEKLWQLTGGYKSQFQPDSEKAFQKFKQRIGEAEASSAPIQRRIPWLRVAATIAVLLGAVLVWQYFNGSAEQTLTVSTDDHSTQMIQLADGTTVHLNRNSQLIFPQTFSGTLRKVQLSGEAFFKVVADPNHPFVIETNLGQVRVLGTAFNVRAMPEEASLEVYVQEGRVRVAPSIGDSYELSSGHFLRFDSSSASVKLSKSGDANAIAWITGRLTFSDAPLQDIAAAIERHYHVHIDLAAELADCRIYFNVKLGRLQDAWDVLEQVCEGIEVEPAGNAHFRIAGRCCR